MTASTTSLAARSYRHVLICCVLLGLSSTSLADPEDPWEGGQWGPVIDWPHIAVSAANLPDGRILTWSGSERETWPTTEQTYSATWDPATGDFVEVFHEGHNMFCAHLAMLEDGRVFVNGGRNQTNSPWTSIFDFRDNEWVQIENMDSGGRWYPTTVALGDGDIFTAIGTATLQRYPERWNVDTGWDIKNGIDFNEMVLTDYFSSGTHGESRWWPLLHVAPNGQIFHSGPTPKMHYIDPENNGDFVQVGPEFTDFYHKHGTTIMYAEGKLITAGGWESGNNIQSTNKAFTIDLNGPSPNVQMIDPMNFARKFHNGIMLPNGEVLVVGGNTSGRKFSDDGAILATEIWSPDTGSWRVGAAMATPRNYHSIALLLNDGRVLAAGSGYCSGSVTCNGASHKDGEVYSPPYLFETDGSLATRPAITSGPGKISSSEVFSVTATPGLQRITMIKMGSTTHGMNTDVRFIELDFEETSSGTYSVTAHPNQNVMTPGYWMLFGLDSAGVPSEAHIVQANTSGMPWIAAIPQQSSQEGEATSYFIRAGDADDDLLQYSATGLPAGLQIDSATGEIYGAASTAGSYEVTVDVTDNDEGSKSRTFTWLVFGQGLGTIRRDWWTGINGSSVSNLTADSDFPDNPDGSEGMTSFEAPTNWADNYGTRMHGYITPNADGAYTFAIAADDGAELWLSTDSNPANRTLIATVPGYSGPRQWDKYIDQTSAPITLENGQTYFIEALQKEGGGGDNLAVGWIRPGDSSISVIPGAYLSPDNVSVAAPADAMLHSGSVTGVGSAWQTITLPDSYSEMVVVATPAYSASDLPVVTRVRNASGDQFELRVQNPSGSPIPSTYRVDFVVAEKGVYAGDGISFEAAITETAITDSDSSWVGTPIVYQNDYAEPVVLGQVFGEADTRWSAFWASDGTAGNPPSAGSVSIGHHVAEDADTTRAVTSLAYFVFESGSYSVSDLELEAGLGAGIVGGYGDAPPYTYSLASDADRGILSAAGMNGANGGWPALYGAAPLNGSQIELAFDEDQIGDTERAHANEEVAYLAISDAPVVPLAVDPVVPTPQVVGSMINFDLSASRPDLEFNWNFGDGSPETGFGSFSSVAHNYATPGRHVISVTIRDPNTLEEISYQFIQLVHWPLTANKPSSSSTIALHESLGQVWSVNPDNNSVTVITDVQSSSATEIPADEQPVSVQIAPDGKVWVVNRKSATIAVYNATAFNRTLTIELPKNSLPYGLAFDAAEGVAFVVLEATGDLLKLDAISGATVGSVYVGKDPRHVAVSADSADVLVTRFITPTLPNEWTSEPIVENQSGSVKYGGEVVVVDPFSMSVQTTAVLEHSERGVSEHTGPGVPNYLGSPVISPDGTSAWIPSKQDNILAGALRGGQGMTFDQTVRAITSKINLATKEEEFTYRVDHDNASVASYAAFGPNGAYLFTSLEGNREIAVSDVYTATEISRFDVGRAPHGVVLSDDGSTLYVHNFMDRTVSVFDVSAITQQNDTVVNEITTISTVVSETLTPDVFAGKQLFYDARDPRLALNSYMSCASCHNDGGQDGRIWDFTGLGEGLKNTITLQGRAATAHGNMHWTANFDELQDFEDQIRNFALGTGLMSNAEYFTGSRSTPLGDPKAGLSPDLDALAAYVASLTEIDESPYKEADGSLTPDAAAGQVLFIDKGCASCHEGDDFTDSVDELTLRDVGTISQPTSGSRLGGPLVGIDTPSLISVWNTAPYLHDGSALDITEAISAHSSLGLSLTVEELSFLGSYLEQLDGTTRSSEGDCTGCINFNELDLVAFSDQNESDAFSVILDGGGIELRDNTWLVSTQTFNINPTTILSITFEGLEQGEIQGLGFTQSDDITVGATRIFKLWGTQNWGVQDYAFSGAGEQTFDVPIGEYYSGSGFRITLANDDDMGANSRARFTSVRLYDPGQGPASPIVENPGNQTTFLNSSVLLQVIATDPNNDTLTFSAEGLPVGLSISQQGLISGSADEVGTFTVIIGVSDGNSTEAFVEFEWSIVQMPACVDCTNFLTSSTSSFSNQDVDSEIRILDSGLTVELADNTWRSTDSQYNISPTTILEFEFEGITEGEIHGIGFSETENLDVAATRIFQIWGSQDWGIRDFTYLPAGVQSFSIPVGQFYTGQNMNMVLVNDDDAGSGSSTRYRNIRVLDPGQEPTAPTIQHPGDQRSYIGTVVDLQVSAFDPNLDILEFSAQNLPEGLTISNEGRITGIATAPQVLLTTITVTDNVSGSDSTTFEWVVEEIPECENCIDFSTLSMEAFPGQDQDSESVVILGGAGIELSNNTWRRSIQTFEVFEDSVIRFEFEGFVEAEIHAIGFTSTDDIASARDSMVSVWGSQDWGISDFSYGGGGIEYFEIPIGQFITGNGLKLTIANDDDAAVGGRMQIKNLVLERP